MDAAMRVAEVFVPAMVMALLRGPLGVLYLVCAAVMKVRRRLFCLYTGTGFLLDYRHDTTVPSARRLVDLNSIDLI